MFRSTLWTVACLIGVVGCATGPPVPPMPATFAWQDKVFDYSPGLVTVYREDLLRLDPQLAKKLADPAILGLSKAKRLDRLLRLLYGQEMKRFGYTAGHSTVAAETWQQRSGDCLSLTVLGYAMARAMNLDAQMQEVVTPAIFDRRDQLDFLSQHVNVLFHRAGPLALLDGRMQAQDMIVDFEPELSSRRVGVALSDQAILARYYNNIAAEHYAKGRHSFAYAHYKAAILADPGYAPSYSNLALMYHGKGLLTDTESLLRHAVTLSNQSYLPLLSLQQLMKENGHDAEAQAYARMLQSKRDSDPYYWIGQGIQQLSDGKFRQAISALEQAQTMTNGFEEVHRYLAVAYWRAGEKTQAEEQLTLLGSLNRDGVEVSRLRKKLNNNQNQQRQQGVSGPYN